MAPPSRRTRLRAVAGLVLAALTACASVTSPVKRDEALEQELDGHHIRRPLGTVWLTTLKLLANKHYQLVGRDRVLAGEPPMSLWSRLAHGGFETRRTQEGGLELETRESAEGVRYHAESVAVSKNKVRVEFYAVRRTGGTPSEVRARDLALELELVRRLEPEAAARIVRTADAAAR